jgi:hypothetical protein
MKKSVMAAGVSWKTKAYRVPANLHLPSPVSTFEETRISSPQEFSDIIDVPIEGNVES